MKIRFRYEKKGMLKFISHLDTMRVFERALRRICAPVEFSKGFNPHMIMNLSNPLPLGVESIAEFLEVRFKTEVDACELMKKLNSDLPYGIKLLSWENPLGKSISDRTFWSVYKIFFPISDSNISKELIAARLSDFLARESIVIDKKRKQKGKKILTKQEIRNMIGEVGVEEFSERGVAFSATLLTTGQGGLNVLVFSKVFNDILKISADEREAEIIRLDLLDENGKSLL